MEKASKDSEEVVQMMERHVTLLITLKNAVNEVCTSLFFYFIFVGHWSKFFANKNYLFVKHKCTKI